MEAPGPLKFSEHERKYVFPAGWGRRRASEVRRWANSQCGVRNGLPPQPRGARGEAQRAAKEACGSSEEAIPAERTAQCGFCLPPTRTLDEPHHGRRWVQGQESSASTASVSGGSVLHGWGDVFLGSTQTLCMCVFCLKAWWESFCSRLPSSQVPPPSKDTGATWI